jgi:alanine dehydrogenase
MEDDGVLVGVPKETYPGESRVALVPGVLPALRKAGIHVVVEHGAGDAAGFPDERYEEHGARLGSRDDVFDADVVAQVRTCGADPQAGRDDVERMRPDQIVIGFADRIVRVARDAGLGRVIADKEVDAAIEAMMWWPTYVPYRPAN